jgi:hypothetical protein
MSIGVVGGPNNLIKSSLALLKMTLTNIFLSLEGRGSG